MVIKASRALVFGASGITGWAIIQEALHYPSSNTFDRVIGLTKRPLTKSDASFPDDERLVLHSGIDLTSELNSLVEELKKVDGIDEVTHVYFAGTKNEINLMLMHLLTIYAKRMCSQKDRQTQVALQSLKRPMWIFSTML